MKERTCAVDTSFHTFVIQRGSMTVIEPNIANGRLTNDMDDNDACSDIEGDFSDPEDFVDPVSDEGNVR